MDGLVSLLDQRHHDRVEVLVNILEDRCGLHGMRVTPYPHFSWQIAETFASDRLQDTMSRWAAEQEPFRIRTSGLGIFSGPEPVVYLPVIRTKRLNRLHASLWELFADIRRGGSPFYAPYTWVPHITLAFGDVTVAKLNCALRILARQTFEWEIEVDNLAVLFQPRGQVAQLGYRYAFQQTRPG